MLSLKQGWTERQAGVFLGVHRQTMATWRFKGRGPVYYKLGRKIVYFEVDLSEYLNRNRVDPEAS